MTNTLQKKLDAVKREKALLEQQIEREESHHGKLKSKLTTMRADKTSEKSSGESNVKEEVKRQDSSSSHPVTILESEDEKEEENVADNE